MKNFLMVVFGVLMLSACKKSSTQKQETSGRKGIYVNFTTESSFVSYSDNNPAIPDNISPGITYGPCEPGQYIFTAKLKNDRTYGNSQYTLSNPAEGFKVRTYTIRFYYAADVNRWLFSYNNFVDSN